MRLLLIVSLFTATLSAASSDAADAAERRDGAALHKLVSQHAKITDPQLDGTTALHWAAHWNDLDSFNLLLRAGATPKLPIATEPPLFLKPPASAALP